MDVKTVCLGLLSIQPASGYDLKKQFESLFRHFFPAGYGSIYPALADLAADGLVDCERIRQAGKPDRKLYRITPAGRSAFRNSLAGIEPRHRLRSEFLAMIYFADQLEADRLREVLDRRIEELRAAVAEIDELEKDPLATPTSGARFVAGFGAAVAQAAADYIEQNRGLLLAHRQGRRPRRSTAPEELQAGGEQGL